MPSTIHVWLLRLRRLQDPHRWLFRVLIVVQLLLVPPVLKNLFYVTTHRLYAEDRIAPTPQDGMVWQQFNVQNNRVVPQIITEGSARLRFSLQFSNASTLWIDAASKGIASYEIDLLEKGVRRQLVRRVMEGRELDCVTLPPSNGTLEISSGGSVVWSDLRIVHGWPVLPYLIPLGVVSLALFVLFRKSKLLQMAVLIAGSCLLPLLLVEAAMHLLGAPEAVQTLRRELGEVSPSPQWEESSRYGTRLRRNQKTVLQWRDGGDIVRMGFIPPTGISSVPDRYSLVTDREGFRNARVRPVIHIAALGDSFTDALTLPVDQIWSTRLEQKLTLPVQNYGTAGFGPQQELRVLRDYAIQHHPHVVLLAFFAGNDIFNAENFDEYERSEGAISLPTTGWSIKKVVPRYETFYLFSLGRLALQTVKAEASKDEAERKRVIGHVDGLSETAGFSARPVPGFDNGIFNISVDSRLLRFALMPPYLNTLGFSRAELERRPGWQITRKTILEMKRVSEDNGATLVVLFIPFKSQVYLPLLERTFGRGELERAFQFYFRQQPTKFDLREMSQNRLAQNDLMHQFCEEEHILLIDPTRAFQNEVEAGRNMYFADDSHWNAAGHELAADAINVFLRSHGLDKTAE